MLPSAQYRRLVLIIGSASVGIDHAQKLGDAVAVIVGTDIGHDQPERPLAVAEVGALGLLGLGGD